MGRPRLNWYQVTMQDMWQIVREGHPEPSVRFAASLDIKKDKHVTAIKEYAAKVATRKR